MSSETVTWECEIRMCDDGFRTTLLPVVASFELAFNIKEAEKGSIKFELIPSVGGKVVKVEAAEAEAVAEVEAAAIEFDGGAKVTARLQAQHVESGDAPIKVRDTRVYLKSKTAEGSY